MAATQLLKVCAEALKAVKVSGLTRKKLIGLTNIKQS